MKARNESQKKGKASAARQTPESPATPDIADYPREELIAVAAYFRAERRGFAPDDDLSDWLAAEAEVENLLKGRQ